MKLLIHIDHSRFFIPATDIGQGRKTPTIQRKLNQASYVGISDANWTLTVNSRIQR